MKRRYIIIILMVFICFGLKQDSANLASKDKDCNQRQPEMTISIEVKLLAIEIDD